MKQSQSNINQAKAWVSYIAGLGALAMAFGCTGPISPVSTQEQALADSPRSKAGNTKPFSSTGFGRTAAALMSGTVTDSSGGSSTTAKSQYTCQAMWKPALSGSIQDQIGLLALTLVPQPGTGSNPALCRVFVTRQMESDARGDESEFMKLLEVVLGQKKSKMKAALQDYPAWHTGKFLGVESGKRVSIPEAILQKVLCKPLGDLLAQNPQDQQDHVDLVEGSYLERCHERALRKKFLIARGAK